MFYQFTGNRCSFGVGGSKLWSILTDLKENGFNLNIPMYMKKIIEDNLPCVEETLVELKLA
ncbi:MAG: hypothetical protein EA362_05045 [Saprospirales bacterium]|nr:MAG: hypothetical protein EA362_05045 [Saprospirales bacterium]